MTSHQPDQYEYLWNWYGTRKHIAKPDSNQTGRTLCSQVHRPRAHFESRATWGHRLPKLDEAPLCQKCAKKAGIDQPPSDYERLRSAVLAWADQMEAESPKPGPGGWFAEALRGVVEETTRA